jgi:hypothetical protein
MRLRRPAPRSAPTSSYALHLVDGSTVTVRATEQDLKRLLTATDLLHITNDAGVRRLIVVAHIAWAEPSPDDDRTDGQGADEVVGVDGFRFWCSRLSR